MADFWLEAKIRGAYQRLINPAENVKAAPPSARPTVVFAPHQDDETLGCGGTMLLKRRAGAEVTLVFMTDGRTSHSGFISTDELVAMRRKEASAAGLRLGLTEKDIHFLAFRDGELHNFRDQAVQCVIDILAQRQPEEVFIPYSKDPQPDHISTNQVVLAAVQRMGLQTEIFEYPVWFWYHWPWVRLPQAARKATKAVIKNTLRARMGLKMKDFQYAVDIVPVLAEKRSALDEHHSQMERQFSNPDWPILADVSAGQFLACFFRRSEVFYRYTINRQKQQGN